MIAAVVAQVSPLLVTIPTVTGQGTVPAVLVQPAAPPGLGDAVWVDQVTGFPGWLVVNVPIGSGPAGAGWSSGTTVPAGSPSNSQVYYLRTTTGDVYLWGGSSWSIIGNLKGPSGTNGTNGTNGSNGATGNGWSSGSTIPVAAPSNNQIYYHHTITGDIYTWSGSAWSVTGNIRGPAGTNGTNGSTGPTGSVIPFAGSTTPSGWMVCDGTAVSRTLYPDLFTAIGTTYGAGNGTTTFNLPNLLGRVVVGVNGSDSDFTPVGKTGGAKTAPHTHTLSDSGQAQIYIGTGGQVGQRRITMPAYTETLAFTATRTTNAAASQTVGTPLTGSTDSASPTTVQPFMALVMIIKT